MKTNTINNILWLIALGGVCIIWFWVSIPNSKDVETKKETEVSYNPYNLTMSQLKMKEAYGWKDVILWIESKESFEKAYNTRLNWMNYPMGFRKDPLCCEPYGCSGNWDLEKCCYNYVIVAGIPNMLEKIANESKGKTLVVIGNTYRINDGENFMGNAYWCENKK